MGVIVGALLFSASSVFAVSTFIVGQGGTGVNTFTPSGLVAGNGTNPLYTLATTTVTCSGSTTCTSFVIPGSTPITISSSGGGTSFGQTWELVNGALTPTTTVGIMVNASSSITQLSVINGTTTNATSTNLNVSGQLKNGSGTGLALTTSGIFSTYAGSAPCSGTQAAISLNASGVITCTNIPQGSVTSIASSNGIIGGTITTSGTLSLQSYLATSSAETSTRIPAWSSTSGTPATLSGGFSGYTLTSLLLSATNASTTQLTASTGLQIPNSASSPSLGTAGYVAVATNAASSSLRFGDGTATRALYAAQTGSLVVSSSTLAYMGAYGAAGTTTILIQTAYRPTTILGAYCQTDTGTANINFYNGSVRTVNVACSTTPTFISFASNNTWTMGQGISLDVGRQGSNPNTITVTAQIRADAD